jgi:hypothetical protein
MLLTTHGQLDFYTRWKGPSTHHNGKRSHRNTPVRAHRQTAVLQPVGSQFGG